jgi:hypothetical protein
MDDNHRHRSGVTLPGDSDIISPSGTRGAAAFDMRRLKALSYGVHYRNLGETGQTLSDQKRLLRYLGPNLEELRCYLTHDFLYRLEVLQRQPQLMRLRKLHLDCWLNLRPRILERLLEWLEDESSSAPALECLRLYFSLDGLPSSSADRVLRVLARRKGLQQLLLTYNTWQASSFALLRNDMESGHSRDAVIQGSLNSPDPASFTARQPNCAPQRRLFPSLSDLEIFVELSAVPALVPLVQPLTRLDINIDQSATSTADVEVFHLLATLTQLRGLKLALSYRMEVAPGSLRALHSLTQLRYLALRDGRMVADVTDDDIAALVRSLPD